jgi:predicted metal-dependent peptidase
MSSKSKQKQKDQYDLALQAFHGGIEMVKRQPIFAFLLRQARIIRQEYTPYPSDGLACVSRSGCVFCNPKRRASPSEWARVLAHCLLHLGMEHFQEKTHAIAWNIACDCVVEKFLTDLRFAVSADAPALPAGVSGEEKLYRRLAANGISPEYHGFGTAGASADMIFTEQTGQRFTATDWSGLFALGIAAAVQDAVHIASGSAEPVPGETRRRSAAENAKQWFISSYPLLGAVAANFTLIEDPLVCQRMEVSMAAISPGMAEIYINPAAVRNPEECRFVLAHELLHAALRHDTRHMWRDAYLWNVACDFVINQWLVEMDVGKAPAGILLDEQFKGLSAEAVYDRIVTDMRTYRKLATLRGVGLGDVLPGKADWWASAEGENLDAFYRRALGQGLTYHQEQGRGYLPAGLVEEIRALSYPPIPWDVELARWFDEQFVPLEKIRSYARPSRRQQSTPDIPRPSRVILPEALAGRTFGVVLDTSGSMDRALLATALGAVASYSVSRDVPAARVVFCDAAAYDQGYMKPEDIAGVVKIRGRGGTVLQPGIDLLQQAKDFPREAPLLVITDAACESRLVFQGREHAFLIPRGAHLPFVPRGKVFRIS